MKLGEILSGPETWMKGNYWDGRGRYCLVGALMKRETGKTERSTPVIECARLQKVIRQLFPNTGVGLRAGGIVSWNDDPARTWEEVAQVVEAYDS